MEWGHIYLGYVILAVSPPELSSGSTRVMPESYPIQYDNTGASGTGEMGLFSCCICSSPFLSIQANASGWEVSWKAVLIPSDLPATCFGGCRKVVL